jgi:CheY-like chemotaxis protein
MLVDDEPFNLYSMRIMLQESLKQLGLPETIFNSYIDYATNGNEALEKV